MRYWCYITLFYFFLQTLTFLTNFTHNQLFLIMTPAINHDCYFLRHNNWNKTIFLPNKSFTPPPPSFIPQCQYISKQTIAKKKIPSPKWLSNSPTCRRFPKYPIRIVCRAPPRRISAMPPYFWALLRFTSLGPNYCWWTRQNMGAIWCLLTLSPMLWENPCISMLLKLLGFTNACIESF